GRRDHALADERDRDGGLHQHRQCGEEDSEGQRQDRDGEEDRGRQVEDGGHVVHDVGGLLDLTFELFVGELERVPVIGGPVLPRKGVDLLLEFFGELLELLGGGLPLVCRAFHLPGVRQRHTHDHGDGEGGGDPWGRRHGEPGTCGVHYFTGVCVSQLSSCLRLVCRSVVGRAFLLCLVPCLGGLVESFAPFTDDRFGVTHVRARFVPDGDVSGEQRNSDDAEGREADVDGLDLVLDRRQLAVREGHQVIRELANRFAFYADAL